MHVLGCGNQFHADFETPDGYSVIRDPRTGFFEYATESPDGGPSPTSSAVRRRPDGDGRVDVLGFGNAGVWESLNLGDGTGRFQRVRALTQMTRHPGAALILSPDPQP